MLKEDVGVATRLEQPLVETPVRAPTERRLVLIWALLFFNVLPWIGIATVVPIPFRVAQVLTMGALCLALLLALSINPRLQFCPSTVLALFSALAALGFISSVRGDAGVGSLLRSGRLCAFVTVLWLLTPWWGRRDLLIVRCHLRALLLVLATVVIGLLVAPSYARVDGRLAGAVWPIWPTAVAHYAAMASGLGVVLWLSGSLSNFRALALGAGGVTILLLTQTRFALLGLLVGVAFASLSLILAHRRVRRVTTLALAVIPVALLILGPALSVWFTRGQTPQQISNLTGRTEVWSELMTAPRSEVDQWIGRGLTDKSFAGRSIDNSWLAIYQDQGLVGIALAAALLLSLVITAILRPPGPPRALALFVVVYCAVHSYTEVGLGDASSYFLDLVVAASVLHNRSYDNPV